MLYIPVAIPIMVKKILREKSIVPIQGAGIQAAGMATEVTPSPITALACCI